MNDAIEFSFNRTNVEQIANHLHVCNDSFTPPLSERVVIEDYARKIFENADRFEAWAGKILIGLVAVYCNDKKLSVAYITSVSVLQSWQGKGIASQLITKCLAYIKSLGFERVDLEVYQKNKAAIILYRKYGFHRTKLNANIFSKSFK